MGTPKESFTGAPTTPTQQDFIKTISPNSPRLDMPIQNGGPQYDKHGDLYPESWTPQERHKTPIIDSDE